MVYDPYTRSFVDDDSDSLLFDPGVEDVFAIDDDDEPSVRDDWSKPAGVIPVGELGSISYDRGNNEVVRTPNEMVGDDVLRERRGLSKVERDQHARRVEREAADTGNRNVGRAAAEHGGAPDEDGGRGQGSVANSVAAAADRLLRSVRHHPSDTGGEAGSPEDMGRATGGMESRVVPISGRKWSAKPAENVQLEPTTLSFNAEVHGIRTNVQGDWMVTIKVPFYASDAVMALNKLTGMNLEVTVISNGIDLDG